MDVEVAVVVTVDVDVAVDEAVRAGTVEVEMTVFVSIRAALDCKVIEGIGLIGIDVCRLELFVRMQAERTTRRESDMDRSFNVLSSFMTMVLILFIVCANRVLL